MANMFSAYPSIWKHISGAYSAYGGLKEIVRSPYLHVSLVLGLLCLVWKTASWPNYITSISPSLLGFTLAGYTVFIASVSGRLLKGMVKAKASDGHSYFQKVNSAFFHFIFVQCVATIYAIAFPALTSFSLPLSVDGLPFAAQLNLAGFYLLSLFGWGLLFYSIMVIVAVLIWIHRIINLNERAILEDMKEEVSGSNQ